MQATGMPDAQQHRMPTRNSFVDRVVANLMYNRFQSPSMRSPMNRQSSANWGGEPHLGGCVGSQRIGSTGMRMGPLGEGPSLDLAESPNA